MGIGSQFVFLFFAGKISSLVSLLEVLKDYLYLAQPVILCAGFLKTKTSSFIADETVLNVNTLR